MWPFGKKKKERTREEIQESEAYYKALAEKAGLKTAQSLRAEKVFCARCKRTVVEAYMIYLREYKPLPLCLRCAFKMMGKMEMTK